MREIVIREDMEPGDMLKAAVREVSTALLDREQAGNRSVDKTQETRELKATSAAYHLRSLASILLISLFPPWIPGLPARTCRRHCVNPETRSEERLYHR